MTVSTVDLALKERFDWIALDFVNTTVVTRSGTVDAFAAVDDLLRWMERADPPGWHDLRPDGVTARRTLHAEAVRLRVAIDALFTATAARRPVDAPVVHALGRALRWMRIGKEVTAADSGALVTALRYEPLHAAAALAPIADDALQLVSSVQLARLRRCRADECLRWFVDTSKGGRRSWCSMATCGNRAKAARFRARHEADVSVPG